MTTTHFDRRDADGLHRQTVETLMRIAPIEAGMRFAVPLIAVFVLSFRTGKTSSDNHSKIEQLARIYTVDKDTALTAAKFEVQILDQTQVKDQTDNRRRKLDCFHIATAMVLGCRELYSLTSECCGERVNSESAASNSSRQHRKVGAV